MLWENVKKELTSTLPESAISLWIDPLHCLNDDEGSIELAGPDRFFTSWVSDKYVPLIRDCLVMMGKENVPVNVTVLHEKGDKKLLPLPSDHKEQLRLPDIPKSRSCIRMLHPRYTFDEFMTGESNALSHSACAALANDDVALGSCLYIDAGTGLGKSHLTHAVAHHILNHSPATRLHYLSLQQLTAEMVRGIKNDTMDQFKDKYYNQCDMLLIEDVHALSGRKKTQSELAAALDVLMESGKRIIFTGAVPPRDILEIDSGIRSRLSAGLITTINPPDLETRLKIITRKAQNSDLILSEEIINYMADNIKGDIRKLESAIVGLKAKACLLKTTPDLGMVKDVVANVVGRAQELTVEAIRGFVAGQFKTSVGDMKSKSRKKSIAFPRQVAMYLTRKLTEHALTDIGKAFNRDHSTVVHSIRVITETMARNGSVRGQLELLTDKLKKRYL